MSGAKRIVAALAMSLASLGIMAAPAAADTIVNTPKVSSGWVTLKPATSPPQEVNSTYFFSTKISGLPFHPKIARWEVIEICRRSVRPVGPKIDTGCDITKITFADPLPPRG